VISGIEIEKNVITHPNNLNLSKADDELKKQVKKSRNYYIDVLKGIAIISVILIHTAFHSGSSYVPTWFSNFTLLFEVPMFFFLAGWSYSYSKGNKSYVKGIIITQIKYMFFVFLIYIAIHITNAIHFSNNPVTLKHLINWFLHALSNMTPFRGVEYSLWFFKVYFFVSLLDAMMITLIKPKIGKYIIAICFIGIFIITFFMPKIGNINLGIELSYILFYTFFYMLGYYTKDKEISIYQFAILFVTTILSLIVIHKFANIDVLEIQKHKFLPNFVFMLWSLFGVYIVIFLKKYFNNCKKNILSVIGQHSMYILFAQGIGSSVLYCVSKYIVMDWYYKICVMFGINILVTLVITILLKLILDFVGKYTKKLLEEKIFS